MNGKREYGDYQTPDGFALEICKFLKDRKNLNPSIIVEPTCGTGSFIKGSLIFDANYILGIEINAEYCQQCQKSIIDPRVQVINKNFFSCDFMPMIKDKGDILVIGNPPWVNNSTLSGLNSTNIPQKINFKGLRGIDALTGASNFDICEYIILKLVSALHGTNATIAMLCKNSVARNVFLEMKRSQTSFKNCDFFKFDAKKVFGINASACLLVIELSDSDVSSDSCGIYLLDKPETQCDRIIYRGGELYSQAVQGNHDFLGKCCFEWRQGVKHDCAKIMELSLNPDGLENGLKEVVNIEFDYVFPLIKSSMFKSAILTESDKYVIVTQRMIGEDTAHIQHDAPKTWEYLSSHKPLFEKRKSTIYNNTPDYSMFGVGEYSYAPYKVGVSGFNKKPLFALLSAKKGNPIMTDDTSYFICLPTYTSAYTAMLILNSQYVQSFLCNIAFIDSKRPFTKKVLKQIDFRKVLEVIKLEDLITTEKYLGLQRQVNEEMFAEFKALPEFRQVSLSQQAS